MITLPQKLLVMEGYNPAGITSLAQAGATQAAILYKRMLSLYVDEAQIEIAEISGDEAPNIDIHKYGGVCWTGSNLFFSAADNVVQRHIDRCREFFAAGIPQIGSCWGAQLAAVAAGGKCELNPKGREFGIARKILLNDAGKNHPMFAGKRSVFDGLVSHADIVTELPQSATLLGGNIFAPVQALDVRLGQGSFWAFQYHPEYDLSEIAALALVRQDGLIEQGSFKDRAAVEEFVKDMNDLQQDISRSDLMWKWGIDEDLLDEQYRTLEIKNWLTHFFAERE